MPDFSAANRQARAELLGRIHARQTLHKGSPADVAPAVRPDGISSPRPGNLAGEVAGSPLLRERFIRFALAGSSSLTQVSRLDDVPTAVASYLNEQRLPRRAAIWSSLQALDWISAGIASEVRAAGSEDAVGITGVFCAIAETGTLLVLSGPGAAATTSLLPETHVAVVPVSRIVAGMEEAFALVLAERGELPRALNFISGPSRTGDIEQTIVLGAHGPSRVHLVLVDDLAEPLASG